MDLGIWLQSRNFVYCFKDLQKPQNLLVKVLESQGQEKHKMPLGPMNVFAVYIYLFFAAKRKNE